MNAASASLHPAGSASRQRLGPDAWLALGLATACAALMLLPTARGPVSGEPAPITANALVHWQGAGRDWLIVADRQAGELVVYDATSGEPLQRLGRREGLGEVASVARLGDGLLVRDAQGGASVLAMPGLQPRALAAR